MPLAKIYVHEGRYDEPRLIKLGDAIQTALEETLGIPPEDYFRIYQVLPSNRYVHTPGFLGLTYTDDLIMRQSVEDDPCRKFDGAARRRRGKWAVGGTSRMPILCGVCDRIETKSNATGETMLALGRERMKLRGVRVPQ